MEDDTVGVLARTELVDTMAIEVEGQPFELRIFADPSGLRGQVFRGFEKIAGVQIYHSHDRDALVREAQRNRAVLRAASAA